MKRAIAATVVVGVLICCSRFCLAGITVYSYSQSASEAGVNWGQSAIADKLTMPSGASSFSPLNVRIRVSSTDPKFELTPADICLWEEDAEGKPGTLLWSLAAPDMNRGWNEFDISASSLSLPGGSSVFAGYTTSNAWWISPFYVKSPVVEGSYQKLDGGASWQYVDADRYVEMDVAPIPEPSTLIVWSLLGASGIGFGWRRRKR